MRTIIGLLLLCLVAGCAGAPSPSSGVSGRSVPQRGDVLRATPTVAESQLPATWSCRVLSLPYDAKYCTERGMVLPRGDDVLLFKHTGKFSADGGLPVMVAMVEQRMPSAAGKLAHRKCLRVYNNWNASNEEARKACEGLSANDPYGGNQPDYLYGW